jgi:hypothetical protein
MFARRKTFEDRLLSGATIRHKLAALFSLYEYLCEVDFNSVKGAKHPKIGTNEGKTPARGNQQARALLDAPIPLPSKVRVTAHCLPCCSKLTGRRA